MNGNGDKTMTKAPGRYTFDESSVPGLLGIMWREDGQPGRMMTTIAAWRMPALARAAAAWMADHPDAASLPEPAQGRVRTGGQRAGALSIANDDDPEGTTP
jgi:hypothetical protein